MGTMTRLILFVNALAIGTAIGVYWTLSPTGRRWQRWLHELWMQALACYLGAGARTYTTRTTRTTTWHLSGGDLTPEQRAQVDLAFEHARQAFLAVDRVFYPDPPTPKEPTP